MPRVENSKTFLRAFPSCPQLWPKVVKAPLHSVEEKFKVFSVIFWYNGIGITVISLTRLFKKIFFPNHSRLNTDGSKA